MFDFYNTMYEMAYLTKQDIHDAAYWGVITLIDYKTITGVEYVA